MSLPFASIPFVNKRVRFPVTPHIPGGLVTPEELRRISEVAEKYGGSLKIVSGGITILGLNLADGEKALAELGAKPESFIAKSVRAVGICPGKPHCPMAQQDGTSLGLALDEEFFGQSVPGKLRIAVSSCPNCCAEVFVKDIGLFGAKQGFTLVVGGNAGRQAQVGRVAAVDIPADSVQPMVRGILQYYRQHGQDKERLGDTLARTGWDNFINAAIPAEYRPK
jgi:NAD(P)H-nitrite reductase large subunit